MYWPLFRAEVYFFSKIEIHNTKTYAKRDADAEPAEPYYWTRVRSLATLVTHPLTDSLRGVYRIDCCEGCQLPVEVVAVS